MDLYERIMELGSMGYHCSQNHYDHDSGNHRRGKSTACKRQWEALAEESVTVEIPADV
ncbi:MAG: hypothetical protein ACLRVO_04590 [Blautia wexlerae]